MLLGTGFAVLITSSIAEAAPQPSVYLILPAPAERSITVAGGQVDLPGVGTTDATGEPVVGGTIVYATPEQNDSIKVSISLATPDGVTISVMASSPTQPEGCDESLGSPIPDGWVALSTTPTALIESIGPFVDQQQTCEATAAIDYRITTAGALGGSGSRMVTFTIGPA